jgi:mono/diheme cytochrome c family protein
LLDQLLILTERMAEIHACEVGMKIKLVFGTSLVTVAMGAFGALGSYSEVAAQDMKSQWNGAFTVEQAARGEALYTDKCNVCHGAELRGTEMAPGLIDDVFSAKWNDQTLADLFDRIRGTMPQNDPGTLGGQQAADLLAFVLLKANYPAGTQELPTDIDRLKMYKFLASKPGTER